MGTISGNERQGITVLISNLENVADYLKVREDSLVYLHLNHADATEGAKMLAEQVSGLDGQEAFMAFYEETGLKVVRRVYDAPCSCIEHSRLGANPDNEMWFKVKRGELEASALVEQMARCNADGCDILVVDRSGMAVPEDEDRGTESSPTVFAGGRRQRRKQLWIQQVLRRMRHK